MKVRRGFTLVELLVTISVIGLLIAIIVPSLRRAREQGRRTVCASNLKQIGVGFGAYLQENGDRLPYASYVPSLGPQPLGADEDPIYIADVLLKSVNGQKELFHCRSDVPGRYERESPNEGKSYFESERSSYEYRTGWFSKDFSVMGKTTIEAVALLERVYRTKVPDNTFWILRDYQNFHSKKKEGGEEESKSEVGARRYLYSDGHVADYENV